MRDPTEECRCAGRSNEVKGAVSYESERRLPMDEDRKREVGTFRFGVISNFVVSQQLERGEQERLLRDKAERQWAIEPGKGRE